jgi:hypothetical protein
MEVSRGPQEDTEKRSEAAHHVIRVREKRAAPGPTTP